MRYKELTESINDKGIFKAVFMAGLPGAGKSTIASRITDGAIAPRMVNTDKSYEFLLKKHGQEATKAAWALLGNKSLTMNESTLANYLNGMLPLFVDGTSANPSSAMRRAGITESLGYDNMMVWINVDFETAIERIAGRERKVDTAFVRSVYDTIAGNKELYRNRFGANFIEVDNNGDNFSAMEANVYKTATKFFSSGVKNPIGQRIVEQGHKYLAPEIYKEEYIKKVTSIWYMK